jgi:ribose transport system permease protein
MVTAWRIPPFIASYGLFWILNGIVYWFMRGETINGFAPAFRALGSGYFAAVPIPVYLMLAALLAATWLMQYTTWGQEIYATGANPDAAVLSGLPVFALRLVVYGACGLMCGLAALVYLARLNSADADMGNDLTLQAIAAALVGGISLFGGSGTVAGALVGSLLLTLVLNGMNLLGVSASWQPFLSGAMVIAAVLADSLARRRRGA